MEPWTGPASTSTCSGRSNVLVVATHAFVHVVRAHERSTCLPRGGERVQTRHRRPSDRRKGREADSCARAHVQAAGNRPRSDVVGGSRRQPHVANGSPYVRGVGKHKAYRGAHCHGRTRIRRIHATVQSQAVCERLWIFWVRAPPRTPRNEKTKELGRVPGENATKTRVCGEL